uniref:Protein Mpv17 n=1 Tax=Tetraselmis sp. GSL018 TaxID=582737 RepID=A0A061SIT4_9CHLO
MFTPCLGKPARHGFRAAPAACTLRGVKRNSKFNSETRLYHEPPPTSASTFSGIVLGHNARFRISVGAVSYDREPETYPSNLKHTSHAADATETQRGTSPPLNLFSRIPKLWLNSAIIAAFLGSLLARFVTVDSVVWRGWTLWEIFSNIPTSNWSFYQECLEKEPLLTPMLITGATYWFADWIAQTYEGNALLDFNTERLLRSSVTGLLFLGPLAHFYYTVQDDIFAQIWPSSPWYSEVLKMLIDNTAYCFSYNFLYYLATGLLKGSSVRSILDDFGGAWWRLQKAGWRIWPYVGAITHTVIPTQHKVLFVDAIEVAWVTYLSLSANAMRSKNLEVVEDVVADDHGELVGEASSKALGALQTYVTDVRENTWATELAPAGEAGEGLPSDSVPQDHLLLAIAIEEAMQEKLAEVKRAALDPDAVREAALTSSWELLPALEDIASGEGRAEDVARLQALVAEEIAAMLRRAEEQGLRDPEGLEAIDPEQVAAEACEAVLSSSRAGSSAD